MNISNIRIGYRDWVRALWRTKRKNTDFFRPFGIGLLFDKCGAVFGIVTFVHPPKNLDVTVARKSPQTSSICLFQYDLEFTLFSDNFTNGIHLNLVHAPYLLKI